MMENVKEGLRLLLVVCIFLSVSAVVFFAIHSASHVLGGFSLFTIAVIIALTFFLVILLCSYQCGDKSINRWLDRTRGVDPRFTGVSVISVPCRYGRTVSSCSDTPSDITHRVYTASWGPGEEDSGLPPYDDDPPPDYYTATGKSPSRDPSNADLTSTTVVTSNNGSGENTCISQEISTVAIKSEEVTIAVKESQ